MSEEMTRLHKKLYPPALRAKQKFPLEWARELAEAIKKELRPHCERCEIAGSIRREKKEVGDIEIIYVPIITARQDPSQLLEWKIPFNHADSKIGQMLLDGKIQKRLKITGEATWGTKIKLAIAKKRMLPVDFFQTTEDAWWNHLVWRTGSTENNIKITAAARRQGASWDPFGTGFTRRDPETGAWSHFKMYSERDVFDFAGLKYHDPKDR